MIITLNQYLSNPQGKGSAASFAKQWRAEYDPRYEKLLEVHGEFEVIAQRANNGNQYFILVRTPSETYEEVTYDVIFKFEKKGSVPSKLIMDWPVRAISNSPSFVYTYENVFKRNKILVEEFKSLLPDESYSEPPEVRNPYKTVGYEKTIYFAARFLAENYKTIDSIDPITSKIDLKKLKIEFSQFDKVMAGIDKQKAKKIEENKKKKKIQKKQKNQVRRGNTILPNTEQKIGTQATEIEKGKNRIKPLNSVKSGRNRVRSVKKI